MKNIVLAILLIISSVAYSQSYVRLGSDIVGNSTKNPVKWVQEGDFRVTTTSSNYSVNFTIRGTIGYSIDIDWGDGVVQRVNLSGSNNQVLLHNYVNVGSYNIFISNDVDKIQRFLSNNQPLTGTINSRFKKWTGLKSFSISTCNLSGGNLENLAHVTDTLVLNAYGNKVSGRINVLSKILKQLVLGGDKQLITGDPDSLSKELTHLAIYNSSLRSELSKIKLEFLSKNLITLELWNPGDSIVGSINSLSKQVVRLSLYNTTRTRLTGSADSLAKTITTLYIPTGSPYITGTFNSLNKLNYAQLGAFPLASASIDTSFRKFTFLIAVGSQYFSGNINNLLNSRYIQLHELGTLTGSIDSVNRQITSLSIQPGSYSDYSGLTGSIDNIPATLNVNLNLKGFRVYYNGGTLPAWGNVTITLHCGFSEAEIRSFLINWSTTAGIGTKTVNVAGTNAPIHVNQTDDPALYNAIQTLISKGKTITFNAY